MPNNRVPPERQAWNDEMVACVDHFRVLMREYYAKVGASVGFDTFLSITNDFQTIDQTIHDGLIENHTDEQILDEVINYWRADPLIEVDDNGNEIDNYGPRVSLEIAIAYCLSGLETERQTNISHRHGVSGINIVTLTDPPEPN